MGYAHDVPPHTSPTFGSRAGHPPPHPSVAWASWTSPASYGAVDTGRPTVVASSSTELSATTLGTPGRSPGIAPPARSEPHATASAPAPAVAAMRTRGRSRTGGGFR